MVASVRKGRSIRSVADSHGVPLSTVQHWVARADGKRLDRVDWEDRACVPKRVQRTADAVQQRVLSVRARLKKHSALGEYGAPAIHRELQEQGGPQIPSIRTIGRILVRHGALDGRQRIRRPAPPKGWYLPRGAAGAAELDSFDAIEGLAIRGGHDITVFTGISLHGGLSAAWPERSLSAKTVVELLLQHWKEVGLANYAQFDNDNRFCGPRQHPDAVGRVIRLCLSLDITPVFAIPNETGFQAAIEAFNGRWQAKVWSRFEHRSLRVLQQRSTRYIVASRQRHAARIESAPTRRPIPKPWQLDLQEPLRGQVIFLRRTNDQGHAHVLGHSFPVDRHWVHRMVRAEVDLDHHVIRFFALRRRDPTHQPMLNEIQHKLPNRYFQE